MLSNLTVISIGGDILSRYPRMVTFIWNSILDYLHYYYGFLAYNRNFI